MSGSMSVVSRLEPRKSDGRREEGDVGMPWGLFFLGEMCSGGVVVMAEDVVDYDRAADGGGGSGMYGSVFRGQI